MELQKATITELTASGEGESFPVQFNPTTLRLVLANRVEGAQTQGRQVRQFLGPSSSTLTVDLVFDTADEGTTAEPRSVREKTRRLERFLVMRPDADGENKPPRIKFAWGDLVVEGVTENLSIDFDHFAANGAPLRAKVALTIKGQDRDQELKPLRDPRQGASAPGFALGGGVGVGLGLGVGLSAGIGLSAGVSLSASVGVALGGESAAEFAARVGVDPAAWRGLDLGGESSLSLSAGASIGFSAGLTSSAGLGASPGLEAGLADSSAATFGLEAAPGSRPMGTASTAARLATGFALSAVGGLTAALETVQQSRTRAAESQTRAAFQVPTPAAAGGASGAAGASRARPRPDARAGSFGFGVPLRPVVGEAVEQRTSAIGGAVALRATIENGEPPKTTHPSVPPWVALPDASAARGDAPESVRVRKTFPCPSSLTKSCPK